MYAFDSQTNMEYQQYNGLRGSPATIPSGEEAPPLQLNLSDGVPVRINWKNKGYKTPVKDQKECNASWAISTVGSIEGGHFAKSGKLTSISVQNLLDCSSTSGNFGCRGGHVRNAFDVVLKQGGINTDHVYPYVGLEQSCKFRNKSEKISIRGYGDVMPRDEKTLAAVVAKVS